MNKQYAGTEETWNTVTHGFGLCLSVAGFALLVTLASLRGSALHIVSCSVFGITLVILYGASTMYHGVRDPRVKRTFRVMDHCAIYLLIAGTYTPFTLVMIQGGWGWTLFGLIWGMTVLGFVCKIFLPGRFQAASLVSYLVMGWLAVIATKPLIAAVPLNAVLWLLMGGLAYTAGTVFYRFQIVRYNHAVWHVFVIAGSLCHYLAVTFYVVPPA